MRPYLSVSDGGCANQHVPKAIFVQSERVVNDWNIRLYDFQRKREENCSKREKCEKYSNGLVSKNAANGI